MTEDLSRLAEAAARGDESAMGLLLERHLPGLRAFVRLRAGRAIRERESSSDIVQSVCREVIAHQERFRYPSEAAFKQWLYATALRKISNRAEFWKMQKRDGARELRVDGHAGEPSRGGDADLLACYATLSTPSRHAIAREEVERFENAFEQLSEEHREVITLAHLVGLSRAEIATELEKSEVAIRALLYRGMARLAELLGDRD
jgi:RNA polymerase sigma-70 factor, ECF subfamily